MPQSTSFLPARSTFMIIQDREEPFSRSDVVAIHEVATGSQTAQVRMPRKIFEWEAWDDAAAAADGRTFFLDRIRYGREQQPDRLEIHRIRIDDVGRVTRREQVASVPYRGCPRGMAASPYGTALALRQHAPGFHRTRSIRTPAAAARHRTPRTLPQATRSIGPDTDGDSIAGLGGGRAYRTAFTRVGDNRPDQVTIQEYQTGTGRMIRTLLTGNDKQHDLVPCRSADGRSLLAVLAGRLYRTDLATGGTTAMPGTYPRTSIIAC